MEACENCKRMIGALETPHSFEGHIVCAECANTLSPKEERGAKNRSGRRLVIIITAGVLLAAAVIVAIAIPIRAKMAHDEYRERSFSLIFALDEFDRHLNDGSKQFEVEMDLDNVNQLYDKWYALLDGTPSTHYHSFVVLLAARVDCTLIKSTFESPLSPAELEAIEPMQKQKESLHDHIQEAKSAMADGN